MANIFILIILKPPRNINAKIKIKSLQFLTINQLITIIKRHNLQLNLQSQKRNTLLVLNIY